MKLNSDLVVLSSCNSGLGEIDPSEGILGMTKAFFEAGAKSVVVSLWDVNDKYTSKFMELFYQRLSEGDDKSKALRLAKIDFIREYSPNPYYWGAFVLSGNTSAISLKHKINFFLYFAGLLLVIVISIIFIRIKKKF
jgi:CHAT domain-containing protein